MLLRQIISLLTNGSFSLTRLISLLRSRWLGFLASAAKDSTNGLSLSRSLNLSTSKIGRLDFTVSKKLTRLRDFVCWSYVRHKHVNVETNKDLRVMLQNVLDSLNTIRYWGIAAIISLCNWKYASASIISCDRESNSLLNCVGLLILIFIWHVTPPPAPC